MVTSHFLFRNRYLFFGGGVIVLYFLIFTPLLSTTFFPNSDDVWYVLDNPQLKDFNFPDVFTKSYQGQYSPLNTLMFYFIKQSFGLNAFYFHLYSLVLHFINGVLVYSIIVKLSVGKNVFIPFFTAFLFLFHPLQIETVAWVSASKWVLVTFFMLVSILFYIQYRNKGITSCIIYSFLFFLLAILSKEVGVILPLLLLIIEVFFLNAKFSFIKKLLPFFILSLCFGIFTFYIPIFQPGLQELRINKSFALWDDIYISIRSVGDYLCYLFIPFDRQNSLSLTSGNQNILLPVISILLFIVSIWLYFLTNQKILMGCFLFFIVNVFFSLPIIPVSRAALIADRYVYIAGIGIWGSLVYMVNKQNLWIKICFSVYLFYIIFMTVIESYKWNQAL